MLKFRNVSISIQPNIKLSKLNRFLYLLNILMYQIKPPLRWFSDINHLRLDSTELPLQILDAYSGRRVHTHERLDRGL